MASITDLTYTDNLAANKQPLLTDWRESLDSIQTYINDSLKDNLVQLAGDCFPAAYAFDSDGAEQYTMDLYQPTTGDASYTGGDVTIASTGAWTDVDAANIIVSATPELAGDFRVDFQFSIESVSSNATNETDVRFRLTDTSDNSTVTPRIKLVTGVISTTNTVPVSLSHVFEDWSAAAKSVKLQYYITTSTNTVIKVLANSNDPVGMYVEKV
jgi:hypothetical protein